MNSKFKVTFIILFFCIVQLSSQSIIINEIMSSNATTIYDEEGDSPDWIELYNFGTELVSLNNFGISDDEDNLFKWEFPDISLDPNDHLLIFASEKDRPIGHWETIIDLGDEWKYFAEDYGPPSNWNDIDFDDSDWLSGITGIGLGDDDDNTIIPMVVSYYLRKEFVVTDLNNIVYALFHVDYDDAFVAYLNGAEIARANIGQPGIMPQFDELAYYTHEAQIYQGGLPDEYVIDDLNSILQMGENVLSIQIHNIGPESSDLSMIPFFTLGYRIEPANSQYVPTILEPLLPKLHTNFKINSDGETLFLVNESGTILDEVAPILLPTDISWGRQPDAGENWFYFNESTPDSSNTTEGFQNTLEPPIFNLNSGFYTTPVEIEISSNQPDQNIYYTLDGSDPSDTSFVYTETISIDTTSVLRAIIIEENALPSKIITHTYFINESFSLPVISLATTPANFFDEETGIYAMGDSAEPYYPWLGANFWKDWEKPIHVESFDVNGDQEFSLDAGIKIHGRFSRGKPQKSFAIFARNQYGCGSIEYQIFEDKPIYEFESILLRNAGNDWMITHMRDAFMTSVTADLGLDYQEYKPVITFLNGYYWGIYNKREKISEHFIACNCNVDPDNIDFLETTAYDSIGVILGDASEYSSLISFVIEHDMNEPENYDYISSLIDIENYTKYLAIQIFYANGDWPRNNVTFWKEKTSDGKWQWILDDLDWAFGYAYWCSWDYNMFDYILETEGTLNPSCSTSLIRNMFENIEFRNSVLNCLADLMNSVFLTGNINSEIDLIKNLLEPEMPDQAQRWNCELQDWYDNIDYLYEFSEFRSSFVYEQSVERFELSGTAEVSLSIFNPGQGSVELNSIILNISEWSGTYFQEVPIELTAIPNSGFEFSGWSGDIISDDPLITLELESNIALTANFEETITYVDSIVINEINYNSADEFDPEDWVEIYNRSSGAINISNWIFKDEDDTHIFTIPDNTILGIDEYLVLCKDAEIFSEYFPQVENYIGDLGFGFSADGELLRLFDDDNNIIDFVEYLDELPWPEEPDGEGPTLSLLNPDYDNALPQSWAASFDHGTPGEINDVYVDTGENVIEFPDKLTLFQNFPNPFNPTTTIEFSVSQNSEFVTLNIYNIKGQKVKTLYKGELEAGLHSVIWNGKNALGKNVSSGIYLYSITDYKKTIVKKMILLK